MQSMCTFSVGIGEQSVTGACAVCHVEDADWWRGLPEAAGSMQSVIHRLVGPVCVRATALTERHFSICCIHTWMLAGCSYHTLGMLGTCSVRCHLGLLGNVLQSWIASCQQKQAERF